MAFQFGPCANSSHNQRADSGHLGSKGGFAGARMAGFRADFSFARRTHNTPQAFCEKHRIKSWSCSHCGSLWLDTATHNNYHCCFFPLKIRTCKNARILKVRPSIPTRVNRASQSSSRPSQSSPRAEPPRADPDLHSLLVPPELSPDVLSTFSGTSATESYFLRPYLEGDLSDMVSKLCVLDGAVMKKSKTNNHHPSDFC